MSMDQGQITRLLHECGQGHPGSADELYRQVQSGLRRLAHRRLGREGFDPLLQTTLLADDVFMEILGSRDLKLENRRHLYALAAQLMERALRMHARTRKRTKRNGGLAPLQLDDQQDPPAPADPFAEASARELRSVMIHSLRRLGEHYGAQTRDTVVLRRGCGMSVQATAELLHVSERTIKRRTHFGLAWLVKELKSKGYEIGGVVDGGLANHTSIVCGRSPIKPPLSPVKRASAFCARPARTTER